MTSMQPLPTSSSAEGRPEVAPQASLAPSMRLEATALEMRALLQKNCCASSTCWETTVVSILEGLRWGQRWVVVAVIPRRLLCLPCGVGSSSFVDRQHTCEKGGNGQKRRVRSHIHKYMHTVSESARVGELDRQRAVYKAVPRDSTSVR